jgi:predicted RNase H-like HicB family nuclease
MTMKFRVLVRVDEDGVFVAECPLLPGRVSQGSSRAVTLANIREAIGGYLQSLKAPRRFDPFQPSTRRRWMSRFEGLATP